MFDKKLGNFRAFLENMRSSLLDACVEQLEHRRGITRVSNTVQRVCVWLSWIDTNEPVIRVSLAEAPHRRQGFSRAQLHDDRFRY
jgi:hypothetical protein